MNNEPVAWAVWEGSVHDMFFTKEEADELCRLKGGDAKSVPLYTHLVEEQDESFDRTASHMAGEYVAYQKELTDEEINEIVWQQNLLLGNDDLRKFAKAILRKAGEK